MEWSVPDQQERYKASLQEAEGSISVSLTMDGATVHIPETSVEADAKPGRVIVRAVSYTHLTLPTIVSV